MTIRYDDLSHDHMLNHPGHDEIEPMRVPGHPKHASCNHDQLPVFSNVGRGISGDGYVVRPKDDGNCEEFYLQGYWVDGATGQETLDWESRNLSGGYLHDLNHTYRVRPWNDPPTFNLTFIYHKPPCCSWAWTTPAIPYCWDEKGPYPEDMVGTGIATLFIRTAATDHHDLVNGEDPDDSAWIEKLVYPDGTTREQFNAPDPLEAWTSNLTFGLVGGDVLVPNLYDLADVLGWPAGDIYDICEGEKGQLDGSDNVKDYIDDQLGFPGGVLPGDGGDVTVYDFILNLMDDLFKKIYNPYPQAEANQPTPDTKPAGKVNPDGTITWTSPVTDRIAMGNMNVYGGDSQENWIKTDENGENDVWMR